MKPITLKINAKAWVAFLIIFFVYTSGLLFYFTDTQNITIIITTAFFASLLVVGAIIGIFYFYQKEVILTDYEIKKSGFPSKSIAYSNIQKIKIGKGGFSIYDKGTSPINITTMYSNFNEAKELINKIIKDRDEIEIIKVKLFQ